MLVKDNQRWAKPYSKGTTEIDGVRYPNTVWDDPAFRAAQGVIEIPDPQLPEGVTDETHYIHTLNAPPYLEWTAKPAEQIAQIADNKALAIAKQHLNDTDYLFTVDKYEQLTTDRAVSLRTSRESARQIIRDYLIKYPQIV